MSIASVLDDPTAFNDAYAILAGQTGSNSDALEVKANNRTYYAQGIQTAIGFKFKTDKINHELNWGFRYHQDQLDRFQWVDGYAMSEGVMKLTRAGTPGTESNRIESADAIATFLQYRIGYGKITATPGIRYEHITLARQDFGRNDPNRTGADLSERSNTVDVVIPGIGIDYRFSKYLSLFAGIHKGFAPPGSQSGSSPEESINYELGVRYARNALSGQVVIFYNDYSNLLGTDLAAAGGGGTGALFNGGKVQTKGLEFQVTYDLLSTQEHSDFSLPLSVVYTFTDAFFENDFESAFEGWGTVTSGDEFPYLANNQLAFILGLEHRRFNVNLSGRYLDKMRTVPGQGDIPANEKTDSYFILDASANYMLFKNIALFGNVTNIADRVYTVARRPAGLRPGMPRAFNTGLKVTF